MQAVGRRPATRLTVLVPIIAAALASGSAVNAQEQTAERLSRPVQSSAMGQDGRLQVSPSATLGNMTVDQYGHFGRRMLAPGADPEVIAQALKSIMCNPSGVQATAVVAIRDARNAMSRADRARLRDGDPDTLTQLSITALARLDGVNPDAVRADEALGPGVYHEAITGFRAALQVCDLL